MAPHMAPSTGLQAPHMAPPRAVDSVPTGGGQRVAARAASPPGPWEVKCKSDKKIKDFYPLHGAKTFKTSETGDVAKCYLVVWMRIVSAQMINAAGKKQHLVFYPRTDVDQSLKVVNDIIHEECARWKLTLQQQRMQQWERFRSTDLYKYINVHKMDAPAILDE